MIKKHLQNLRKRKKDMTVDEALKKHINPHNTDKKNSYKNNTLLMSLLIGSIIVLCLLGTYVGYVSYHAGKGGYIYELDLQFARAAYAWSGLYGASFGVGITQPWEFNLTPGSMSEANVFFDCFEKGIEHEIYASTVPQSQVDTDTLQPATFADLDNFMAVSGNQYTSSQYTFTDTRTFFYGSRQINNVPVVYTNTGTGTDPNTFVVGALKDGNNNIVMVAVVFENLTNGFNDRFYNYQLLLPMSDNSSTMYYLWNDPNDICLAGSQTPEEYGVIQGNVTDTSGNPIESTLVVADGKSTLSAADGSYNLTTSTGTHLIIAIKEGYKVYQNEVNVTLNNITIHNIVLELEQTSDYTDIGPSFDSGKDDPGTSDNVGPGEVPYQIESPQVIEGDDFVIPLVKIYRKLKVGEFSQETITIQSYKTSTMNLNFEIIGDVANMTSMDAKSLSIPTKGSGRFTMTFFANMTPGSYNGTLNITGDVDVEIPIVIDIIEKDKFPIQAMLLGLSAGDKTLYAGSIFTFRTDLTNLLIDEEYPVHLIYTIQNLEGTRTVWFHETNVFLKTSTSILKNVELPPDLKIGDYVVRVTAQYLGLSSSTNYVFTVELPFYMRIIFGKIRVWHVLTTLFGLLALIMAIIVIKRKIEANKKYHLKVDQKELPQEGPRNIWVGKIAETNIKAYMNLEKFKVHTIDAGSTGGGKSFSAQVIIEEMLKKDVAVMVFDPTAQWTGMLRKLTNKGLLALYPNYGMKASDAMAFKGNIRQINNARELIDIKKYMKPGEIQVFACHKLDPKDIDMFVANTIRQVFRQNFDESEPLRLMLIYDEVHRLLPKFGGSGEGFLQIERACREFRKWGIGVMLISQVLADFVGQIKANINTEIQMRTRDEGDLERIKTKFGGDVLQSLVKASVGTGMVQNSAYNRGKPYFITFRPILHSVARLTDEEIEKYNEFNEQIDQVEYELDQLEKLSQDVFDLKLELKLALDKVKAGNFNMAQIYLEGLLPRIRKFWDKLGKEPKKLEKNLVSEEEMSAELEKAKAEREKYEKEHKTVEKEGGDAKSNDPVANFKKDVPPDKILHLHNDMLVVTPNSLYSEIQAMKDKDFEFHVNNSKNDFADWIRDAVGDKELGDLIEQEMDKKGIMDLLDKRVKGEKLPKLVVKKKTIAPQEEEKSSPEENKKAVEEMAKSPENAGSEQEQKPVDNTGGSQEQKQETPVTQATDSNSVSEEESKEKTPPAQEAAQEEQKPAEEQKTENNNEVESPKPVEAAAEENKPAEENAPAEQPEKTPPQEAVQETKPAEEAKAVEEFAKPVEGEKSAKEFEKQTVPESYFRLGNGVELKSIKDLMEYIPKMSNDEFKAHVNNEKNDFANWIDNVFHENELANKIRNATDKGSLEEVLTNA